MSVYAIAGYEALSRRELVGWVLLGAAIGCGVVCAVAWKNAPEEGQ